YISWSASNRSALVRVPAARGNSTRAEFRSPDPTCNPYLCFAAMLAAGLDGIRNKIAPPESTDVNIYHLSDAERKKLGIEMLPGSLLDATDALNRDQVVSKALGPHIMEGLNSITQLETDSYRTTVHPWELDRYLATY
ncbi:MAG: type I glutamate--ammonia ligase, partial [Methanoregulaceae archaeon]